MHKNDLRGNETVYENQNDPFLQFKGIIYPKI